MRVRLEQCVPALPKAWALAEDHTAQAPLSLASAWIPNMFSSAHPSPHPRKEVKNVTPRSGH